MTYQEFVQLVQHNMHETIYEDSEGRSILIIDLLDAYAMANNMVAAEREACAKLCDDYEEWCGPWGQDDNQYAATESAMEIAKAIRARGQA